MYNLFFVKLRKKMTKENNHKKRWRNYWWLIPVISIIVNIIYFWNEIQNGRAAANAWNFSISLVFAAVSVVIIARKSRQIIGWLLVVVPLLLPLDSAATNYLLAHPPSPNPETLILLVAWFTNWDWMLFIGALALVLQLFPTGSPISKRWRWLLWLLLVTLIFVLIFSGLVSEIRPGNLDYAYPNPIHFLSDSFQNFLNLPFGVLLIGSVSFSVVSVFVRYRRGEQTERAQIRWLLYAAILFFITWLPGFFSESLQSGALFNLSILLVPIAIGIAVLQYHLWDINVVINRTLVYGLLTALIAAIWAGSLTVMDQVITNLVGDQSKAAATVLSTLLAASVVQPARTRIEKWINKRFFPEKRQLEKGFIEIEPRFWGHLDINQIAQLTVERVCGIMNASKGAFLVRNKKGMYLPVASHGIELSAVPTWIPDAMDMKEMQKERVTLWEENEDFKRYVPLFIPRIGPNEVIGLLALSERKNGRGYSGDDLKSLVQLGGKIGEALYNLELEGEG
jgi:hypothetical protein